MILFLPYAHIISYLVVAMSGDEGQLVHFKKKKPYFLNYRPTKPNDRRRGQRVLQGVVQRWTPKQCAQIEVEHQQRLHAKVEAGLEGIQQILFVQMLCLLASEKGYTYLSDPDTACSYSFTSIVRGSISSGVDYGRHVYLDQDPCRYYVLDAGAAAAIGSGAC